MTKKSRISSDVDFEQDGKQVGFLRLPYSVDESAYGAIPIPVICIKNGDGPRVLLIAGNHGDEYEGQVTLIKLCQELEPTDVQGRIIILPAANFPATAAGRRTSPIDQGNLNRSFPGNPDGSITEIIADYIESTLMPLSDYCLDFHSGGKSLMYLPMAEIKRSKDPRSTDRAIALLKSFGAPYSCVTAVIDDRTWAAAALRQNLIYLATELGGAGTVSLDALAVGENGVRRGLQHIGAVRQKWNPVAAKKIRMMQVGGREYYVYTPDDGLFEPLTALGDEVRAGQPAAAIHFPDTPWRPPVIADFQSSGMVICQRIPGRTKRLDCLYHLATDSGD